MFCVAVEFHRTERRFPTSSTVCFQPKLWKSESMKLSTSIAVGTASGVVVAILWLLTYHFGPPDLTQNIAAILILLLIWPSSILLIADPTDSNTSLQVVAVALNGVFYGGLGGLLWAAKRWRSGKWFLAGALVTVNLVMALWVLGLL